MHTEPSSTSKHYKKVTLAALGIFLLKTVFIITAPIRGITITSWIIDDTMIIMAIARNIALGRGFTYDFVHATTGAPPLWTYMTSLNHLFFPFEWAVKTTFIETAFLGSLATLLVFAIAKKVTKNLSSAWIAFVLASLTGNAFFESMNGMDTSLFTLGIVLTVAMYLGVGRPKNWPVGLWGSAIGLVAGITSLVRGDGIFIIGTLGILEFFEILWGEKNERRAHRTFLMGMCMTALIPFILLIGWQMLRTGSPFLANQVGRRELAMSLHAFSYDHFILATYLKIVFWNVFQLEKLVTIACGASLLALLGTLSSILTPERKKLAMITLISAGTFFLTLVTYQWYFPDLHGLRYINPAVHLFAILIAGLLTDLPIASWRKTSLSIMTIAIIVLSYYSFYDLVNHIGWAKGMTFTAHPNEKQEKDGWEMIDWINKNIPKDSIIGVRDHGRVALFTERPIQDLAGNIDPIVPILARNGGLKEYLKERNVSYLLIPSLELRKDLIYQVLFRDLPLTLVKNAPISGRTFLYKIHW